MAQKQERAATKTILIVEDDADIGAFLVQAILEATSYEVVLVSEGSYALRVCEEISPDLLILNYNLPGLNGIELSDHLHAREGLEHIPTIMVSATLPIREVKKRGIYALEKPFDLNTLLETVERLLS